jgi:hypothetical protein
MPPIDPQKLRAARDQLKAEREQIIASAVESGAAVLVPVAVTTNSSITLKEAKERKLAELRQQREKRESFFDEIVIDTGVPRQYRETGAVWGGEKAQQKH